MNQSSISPRHQQISARFSAAAGTYAEVSRMQDRVARQVLDMVPDEVSPRRILDAGCGTGRLMVMAGDRWPQASLTGVDIAEGMIREARMACVRFDGADFIQTDIAMYESNEPFDLVLSSSALHWLHPFAPGIGHVVQLCRPGGLVALAIMLDGTMAELRAAREAAAPDKRPVGRLPTLMELENAVRAVPGIRIRRIQQVRSEYDLPTARDVLRSVHDMGVTGGDVSRSHLPLTRGEIAKLRTWYHEHHATPEGVRVSFVTGYVLAQVNC